MDENEYVTIDLQEIFSLLIKKIHWIILSAVIVGGIGFALNWFILKPVYQADSMIIVNTRDEQNVVVTNDQLNSARQLVNTYEVILKSDTVMDQVLNALINRGLIQPDQMSAKGLKNSITVSPVNNTQVMKVSAVNIDPELALAMVDEVLTIAPSIIIRTVKAGSVEIVSYPKLNSSPVSPKKTRNLALCLFGGAAAAAGFIILQELLDNTVKTDQDIRDKIGLPVLGVIPKIRESDLDTKKSDKNSRNPQKELKAEQNG